MVLRLLTACSQRDTLDLSHGQREFLSRELAEDALEPLLADGAAVTRVSDGPLQLVMQRPSGWEMCCHAGSTTWPPGWLLAAVSQR